MKSGLKISVVCDEATLRFDVGLASVKLMRFQTLGRFLLISRISTCDGIPGLPRHRENREFGSPFFQTGKTQGIC